MSTPISSGDNSLAVAATAGHSARVCLCGASHTVAEVVDAAIASLAARVRRLEGDTAPAGAVTATPDQAVTIADLVV